MPFQKLGLHPDLIRAVKALGYVEPTPIQREAIPLGMQGVDVMGCAQTGSGKTAAFVLPILHRLLTHPKPGLRVLVLVPTRELADQVQSMFRECGRFTHFRVAMVIGGVGYHDQIRAVKEGAQIMVATPGRLLDHLTQRAFNLTHVDHLVLDEADRMFDMGFLPDIRSILSYVPHERTTLLFSATLVPEVERIAAFALKNPQRVEIARPGTTAEGISQVLYPVVQSQKMDLLVTLLKTTEMRSVLIFCRTKFGADRLAHFLETQGHPAEVLHSNRTQGQRTTAMTNFRKGRSRILVATDIAARGIDVHGISHVINYDVPLHPEDYVHRVGRTARAYGVGDAITLMDTEEQAAVTAIERFLGVVFPRAMVPDFPYRYPPRLVAPKYMTPWQRQAGRRAKFSRRPGFRRS
ncbi:MAG TPA: DEAD/DEAH box helicase [Elusimicrobiota bacterium]|nr:DEAD/DEAH box helicase [Elusimicrobiota bacterium]